MMRAWRGSPLQP